MLDAIVPILDFGKGVSVAYHKGEDTHTEFERGMQKAKQGIFCHCAHRHIVCCTTAPHMKNHHEENSHALDDLSVVTRELEMD